MPPPADPAAPAAAAPEASGGFVEGLFSFFAESMMDLLDLVIAMLESAPEPELIGGQGNFFGGQYDLMMQIGLWLALPIAVIAVIQSVLKGGLTELLKTMIIGVPIAILGGTMALFVVAFLQRIVNDLSNVLLDGLREDYQAYTETLAQSITGSDAELMAGQLLVMIGVVIMSLVLILEMLFRTISIYLATLFLPLALAAFIWEGSRSWLGRLAEIITALVVSKLVIVAVLAFGFAIVRQFVGQPGNVDGVFTILVGFVALGFATMASPALVMFALSPNMDQEAGSRAQLSGRSSFNHDRATFRKDFITGPLLRGKKFGGGG